MKKFLAFGLVATAGATYAFAASVGVPWFVDNSPANAGVPPSAGVTALVFLHNNLPTDLECDIKYYTENGVELVPTPINTFVIPANSSIAFRPATADPSAAATTDILGNPVTGGALGQEGQTGFVVPDRPLVVNTPPGNDGKKNGSIVVSWVGGGNDVQGQLTTVQTFPANGQGGRLGNNQPLIISYAHLLPPGN